ncbi:hypothetical protein T265_05094 [Opisthorchis viverrini]|uniref:Uncharacterized protein n=1 Tax=Opisthorchis viverrini TaxID=6198 RepID=A0A074ZX88_OPIVI|nr:hypothetical protein T265_05094 [Opisthorchis viverrini]KER27970.1 hypothetical protein T265_05094 [Opisthorchis viverrini]
MDNKIDEDLLLTAMQLILYVLNAVPVAKLGDVDQEDYEEIEKCMKNGNGVLQKKGQHQDVKSRGTT